MRPHLLSMVPPEIEARLRAASVAVRSDEARRLLVQEMAPDAGRQAGRRPLSRRLRAGAAELFDTRRPELVERVEDPGDGFVKYLFRTVDRSLFEAVRIPLHRPGRFSICLSSQVGCALGCDFCATGRLGLTRQLGAGEMVGSFLAVREDLGRAGRVTGAVFMGQGEPLHNYDEVMRAARVLAHPCGGRISAQAITISTVGLVPRIARYTRERHPYRLIVSLTSAIDGRRARLLPVAASRWTVAELASAIRLRAAATGRRVTVAWVLISGVNTGTDEVDALGRLFPDGEIRLNLIDVNDSRPGRYRPPCDLERNAFLDRLRPLGLPVIRRYSGGAARHAACGMLANLRADRLRIP